MQPCKTGDQPYSDASPNGECSLFKIIDKHKFLFLFPDLKKHFEVPPYSQQVAKGAQVEVRCHPPRGKPPPQVYWLQNGRKVDPAVDKNFLVTAEGHLIVVAARLTDSANYSCVAENIASTRTSDPAAITVYGKALS